MTNTRWSIRPSEWLRKTVEEYRSEHPKENRTDAINALIAERETLKNQLKTALADNRTLTDYTKSLEVKLKEYESRN